MPGIEKPIISPLQRFPFAADWLAGALPDAFYQGEMADWKRAADSVSQVAPWSDDEIAELAAFNQTVGNDAGALMAAQLAAPRALAVVTGQQPDFLAAPLFVLYKALSTVAWSRKIAAETGQPCVPIFWVGSDDHDFDELRQCWVVDRQGQLVDLGKRVGRAAPAGSPAYLWNVDAAPVLELGAKIFSSATVEMLAGFLAGNADFETAFCRSLAALLGPDFPMVFISPRLRCMRKRQIGVLKKEFGQTKSYDELLVRSGQRFEEAGYPVPFERDPSLINAFLIEDGVRRRLRRTGGGNVAIQDVRHGHTISTTSEQGLIERLEAHPEDFSPNVVTRPMVQDSALPCVLYVAGPGEIAYLSQIRPFYQMYEARAAAVALRTMVFLQMSAADTDGNLMESDVRSREVMDLARRGEAELNEILRKLDGLIAEEEIHARQSIRKTGDALKRNWSVLRKRAAHRFHTREWDAAARRRTLMQPPGRDQERALAPWNFVCADAPDKLAQTVMQQADMSQPGLKTITWEIEEAQCPVE